MAFTHGQTTPTTLSTIPSTAKASHCHEDLDDEDLDPPSFPSAKRLDADSGLTACHQTPKKTSEKNPSGGATGSRERVRAAPSLPSHGEPPVPPDGGWGWVVVFSSFMISLLVDGVSFSAGIFFNPLKNYYGASVAETAWVGSVLNGSYLSFGPIVSACANRYGCRKIAIFGSVFAAVAFFISTFSPTMPVLIITYGLLGGIGLGFMYLPAIVMVGHYFEKRRALATGIACCGSGIGAFLFAPISSLLLEEYSWKGATWIISALVLNGAVFSIFYRPVEHSKRRPRVIEEQSAGRQCAEREGLLKGARVNVPREEDPSRAEQRAHNIRTSMEERARKVNGGFTESDLNSNEGSTVVSEAKFVLDKADSLSKTARSDRFAPDVKQKNAADAPKQTSGQPSAVSALVNRTVLSDSSQLNGGVWPASQGVAPSTVTPSFMLGSANGQLAVELKDVDVVLKGSTMSSAYSSKSLNYGTENGPVGVVSLGKRLDGLSAEIVRLLQVTVPEVRQTRSSEANVIHSDMQLAQVKPVARMTLSQSNLAIPSTSTSSSALMHRNQGLKEQNQQGHPPYQYDIVKPLPRKDIFYSGSLDKIPEFCSSSSLEEYREMVTGARRTVSADHDVLGDFGEKGLKGEENLEKVDHGDSVTTGSTENGRRGWFQRYVLKPLLMFIDVSLLKSPTFIIYGMSCFFCMLGFFVPFIYLPTLCMDMGIEPTRAAFLISIIGIANTVGRVVVGYVSDQPWADCLLINNVALVVGGALTCAVPVLRHYALFAAYAGLFGTAIAIFVSLRSIIMVELMGLQKLTNAFGLVIMFQGISSFIGSPIAGVLSDITGDYSISFYVAGVFMGLAGLICFPLRRIANWEARREQKKEGKELIQDVADLSVTVDNIL